VSQILPFLVALHAARPGYVVFIEQPEIHLHPRAQMKLAEVIGRAINRGVNVWMETHSSVLLRALQTLIAEGEIRFDAVRVNWFQREQLSGLTRITSREPDRLGRFGDWPADFDEVSMLADRAYLDAVSKARTAG
jgi:predicted ATPase